ncbi:molybdenum cofactor biosynthesis protein [Capsulimonas corticalis]|uniref:Molybdenum cofactor biosynthesis protein n=1 Tax=Capsulimonas corticalis TaxID=2219043 RepID=A0A402CTS8_9BACT|nr:MOSC N-terminal beta barrel domain-containing protein [Capsulimonas corticalis]BDI30632.1 molybdenum cofactor biosynthesis protein [Capsulimonas corticalis]
MPYLAGIVLYPIKALDPIRVSQARIVGSGALEHDRELAIVDAEGRLVNGKRNLLIHNLCTGVNWDEGVVYLDTRQGDRAAQFHLDRERDALEAWLSDYFSQPVTLRRNAEGGFPDDPKNPGPTIIGRSSIEQVASWYDGVTYDETKKRFRANLEIGDAEPFWEDRLFGPVDENMTFSIGDVQFEGTNPCQRCIVPTRDTKTGASTDQFAEIFRARREESLPEWATRERFNHFYRLSVNTRLAPTELGKMLRVGDEVRLSVGTPEE